MSSLADIHDLAWARAANAIEAMNRIAQLYHQQGMRLVCRCCGAASYACHFDKPMTHHAPCLQHVDAYPWRRYFNTTDILRRSISHSADTVGHEIDSILTVTRELKMAVHQRIEPQIAVKHLLAGTRLMLRSEASNKSPLVGDYLYVCEEWNSDQFASQQVPAFTDAGKPVYPKHAYAADWPAFWGEPALGWLNASMMPSSLSRFTLRVTNVVEEHLPDISETDALLEGVYRDDDGKWRFSDCLPGADNPVEAYKQFWDACWPGTWDLNPLVSVVSFDIYRGNIHEISMQNGRAA